MSRLQFGQLRHVAALDGLQVADQHGLQPVFAGLAVGRTGHDSLSLGQQLAKPVQSSRPL
jgi:hypothetical protein